MKPFNVHERAAIRFGATVLSLAALGVGLAALNSRDDATPIKSATYVESYQLCVENPDGSAQILQQYPCMWDNSDPTFSLYTLVRGQVNDMTFQEDFPACRTEDDSQGTIGCVWDSAKHGNGQSGPGVARFVVNRVPA